MELPPFQQCPNACYACGRVVVASTGKRSAQQLTGVDGDVIGLDGNGWVIVRTSDGSETLRIQQRYLSKQTKDREYEVQAVRAKGRVTCSKALWALAVETR